MPRFARVITLLSMFVWMSLVTSAQTVISSTPTSIQRIPQEGPAPIWSYSLPATNLQFPSINAAALAPNGRCVAVAGVGTVDVLDMEGEKLWSWEYGKVNRFIRAGGLAVSPTCNEIALVGDSSYKYTWIVNRFGLKVPIQTTSTPQGIAFSHDGELITLGTAGCDLLLIRKSGDVKWKKSYDQGFCIFGAISFAPADRFIMLHDWTIGLMALDGSTLWTRPGWGMAASQDSQTFISWSAPNHGPQVGSVTSFNADGRQLWSRVAPGETAAISASGDKIAAPVYEPHDFSPEEWDKYQDQPVLIQIFSRSGEVLKTVPVEGSAVLAISPDGNRLLVRAGESIEEIDTEGNIVLKIPDQAVYSTVIVSADFSGALVWRRAGPSVIEWFSLK